MGQRPIPKTRCSSQSSSGNQPLTSCAENGVYIETSNLCSCRSREHSRSRQAPTGSLSPKSRVTSDSSSCHSDRVRKGPPVASLPDSSYLTTERPFSLSVDGDALMSIGNPAPGSSTSRLPSDILTVRFFIVPTPLSLTSKSSQPPLLDYPTPEHNPHQCYHSFILSFAEFPKRFHEACKHLVRREFILDSLVKSLCR